MFLSSIWELEELMQLRVVILLWQWWLERNRVREGERRRSASELAYAYVIAAQSDEFLKIGSKEHRVQSTTPKRWCKPIGNTLKINVDGSYIVETSRGGWVLRSEMQKGQSYMLVLDLYLVRWMHFVPKFWFV